MTATASITQTIIQQRKQALRQKMKQRLQTLTHRQIIAASQAIQQQLTATKNWQQAQSYFVYLATSYEIQTQNLIQKLLTQKETQNKVVAVPKIINQKIVPIQLTANSFASDQLQTNRYGILEPIESKPYQGNLDICLVPGLAFDQNLKRLGRGGGYYDRFLQQHNILSIGLAYDWQIVTNLPTIKTDQQLDILITPSHLITSTDGNN